MLKEEKNNDLTYMSSYLICKDLLQKGLINNEVADRLNEINARYMGVQALDLKIA